MTVFQATHIKPVYSVYGLDEYAMPCKKWVTDNPNTAQYIAKCAPFYYEDVHYTEIHSETVKTDGKRWY